MSYSSTAESLGGPLLMATWRGSAAPNFSRCPIPAYGAAFRGGCSIILSLGHLNTVDFVVQRNIKSYRRFEAQRAHMRGETDAPPPSLSLYTDERRPWQLDFNLLHRQ